MAEDYIELCETLWRDWLAESLDVSPFIESTFDLQAAPEPYVLFNAGLQPLIALLTNPGQTMPHQLRENVKEDGVGPLTRNLDYATAAHRLGVFYQDELKNAAGARIDHMLELSRLVGAQGVMNVETCPFHSRSLPNKMKLVKESAQGGFMKTYVQSLQTYLAGKPVVIVSAVSARESLHDETKASAWPAWQAQIAGLDLATASFTPLVKKGKKITCGAFVSTGVGVGAKKALVLMMGRNNLPGTDGLRLLAKAILGSKA